MKTQRLHAIAIENNINIAVLDLGKVNKDELIENHKKVAELVKPPLMEALKEHFDAEIVIKTIEVIRIHPFTVVAHITIEQDGDPAYKEKIEIEETWIY